MANKRIVSTIRLCLLGSLFLWTFPLKGAEFSTEQRVITIEIRYIAPEAGTVDFVWGVDGWQLVSEELRDPGSSILDGHMLTPMARDDETFLTQIRVPAGSSVQYGFRITTTAAGENVDIWDKGKDPKRDYSPMQPILIASYDKVFALEAAFSLDQPFTPGNNSSIFDGAQNTNSEIDPVVEETSFMTMLSRHWPLLLAGLLILLGIFLGMRTIS